jgi:hypothetical protein
MIPLPLIHALHSWKTFPIACGVLAASFLALVVEPSPAAPWLLGALVTISLAILGLLWKIQGRISILETQVTPLWAILQKEVADSLHHPHPESERMDYLLEKLEQLSITPEETAELKALARAKADDPNQSPIERERAETLLFIMPKVVNEAARLSGI